MFRFFYRILPLALVVFLLSVSIPVSAAEAQTSVDSGTKVFTSDYKDYDGNIVGTETKKSQ